MKNIHSGSDEDFDKLFREKLYGYERNPTDAVWTGIANELDGERKRRPFPILRIAAASLAAIISLGIWLAKTDEPMKLTAASDPGSATIKQQKLVESEIVQPRADAEVEPVEPVMKKVEAVDSTLQADA